jgi:ribosome-binding protein aMBF1 (putative translation factor)
MRKIVEGKHYPHNCLSETYKCKMCGRPIKERLVLIKDTLPKLCYRCWKKQGRGRK